MANFKITDSLDAFKKNWDQLCLLSYHHNFAIMKMMMLVVSESGDHPVNFIKLYRKKAQFVLKGKAWLRRTLSPLTLEPPNFVFTESIGHYSQCVWLFKQEYIKMSLLWVTHNCASCTFAEGQRSHTIATHPSHHLPHATVTGFLVSEPKGTCTYFTDWRARMWPSVRPPNFFLLILLKAVC